jgi:hypothetical protein
MREPYRVMFHENKLWWAWDQKAIDTSEIVQMFGAENLGTHLSDPPLNEAQKKVWTNRMIWVCAPDPVTGDATFYSHVCVVEEFHHTSFTGGESIIGAGEWVVKKGELQTISGVSGHYLPPIDFLYRAVLHLGTVFTAETVVLLYDTVERAWIDYPVKEFIRHPRHRGGEGGHELRVHPNENV